MRKKVIQLTYAFYMNSEHDLDKAEKELKISISKAYDLYQRMLALIVALTNEGKRRYDIEKGRAQREGRVIKDERFVNNRFAIQLSENEQLCNYLEDQSHRWTEEEELIKRLYSQIVSSELYENYRKTEDCYEEDRIFWRQVYKFFIMENEDIDEALEASSLYWNHDKDIIDTFVMKTIKRFDADQGASQPLLEEYSGDEDCDFAIKLLRCAILNAEEYQSYMAEYSQNWNFERLAFMDMIIMQLAIAEMINFPTISVNVTISNYVDLAKQYSTVKSWKFVNGMLDAIAHNLVENRKMLKEVR